MALVKGRWDKGHGAVFCWAGNHLDPSLSFRPFLRRRRRRQRHHRRQRQRRRRSCCFKGCQILEWIFDQTRRIVEHLELVLMYTIGKMYSQSWWPLSLGLSLYTNYRPGFTPIHATTVGQGKFKTLTFSCETGTLKYPIWQEIKLRQNMLKRQLQVSVKGSFSTSLSKRLLNQWQGLSSNKKFWPNSQKKKKLTRRFSHCENFCHQVFDRRIFFITSLFSFLSRVLIDCCQGSRHIWSLDTLSEYQSEG